MMGRGSDRVHPGRIIAGSFLVVIAIGAVLLSTPWATASGERARLLDAVFTSTSAVCVTGLVTVDTGSYWSVFGQLTILGLIQVGGLGLMTLASLTVVLISRRLGVRARMVAQAQTRTLSTADIGRVVRNVTVFTVASEVLVALVLTIRFTTGYQMSFGEGLYSGVFHSISAFNNAGFSLNTDSLMPYVADAWVILTISAAVVVGGLGFPVLFEIARAWRKPRSWSVTTKITIGTTAALLVLGTLVMASVEHRNPDTIGAMPAGQALLASFFAALTPRTAGFNSIDVGAMTSEGLLATDVLMFIGGGSAGTAGGIKVTTVGLLAIVVWAEMRGNPTVNLGFRQIPADNQRQALAVAVLGALVAALSTFILMNLTDFSLDQVMFETISALGTVGLSTGITAQIPDGGKWVIIVLMYLGRLGPLTLASALALRPRERRWEPPTERITVG